MKNCYGRSKVSLKINRLVDWKGINSVIKSIPLVLEKIPNSIYLIGGTGSREGYFKQLVTQLNRGLIIKFSGFIPENDLPGYYALCDVFILANRQVANGELDGFGMVFIEANSYGKPVIGGNVGGVSETIINGETGLLVDGSDTKDIAEKAIRLLRDTELAKRLGENGRKRSEQFWWQKITKDFRKACTDLIK